MLFHVLQNTFYNLSNSWKIKICAKQVQSIKICDVIDKNNTL